MGGAPVIAGAQPIAPLDGYASHGRQGQVTSLPGRGATYVALGDSYSAGEGLHPFQDGTNVSKGASRNECHRSTQYAYSDVQPAIVLPLVTDRSFWACSGATATEMTRIGTKPDRGDQPQANQPSQVSTVGSATRYVTITAGGNDVGFGKLGVGCAQAVISHVGAVGGSVRDCDAQIADSTLSLVPLQGSLTRLYSTLLHNSPQATLVVAGYPQVFPRSYAGVPRLLGSPFCVLDHEVTPLTVVPHVPVVVDVGMPVKEAMKLGAFIDSLDSTIHRVVNDLVASNPSFQGRLRYADTEQASVPHNCKGTTPHATVAALELSPTLRGISGSGLKNKYKLLLSSATFHPTKEGQRLIASRVQAAFAAAAGVPTPTPTPPTPTPTPPTPTPAPPTSPAAPTDVTVYDTLAAPVVGEFTCSRSAPGGSSYAVQTFVVPQGVHYLSTVSVGVGARDAFTIAVHRQGVSVADVRGPGGTDDIVEVNLGRPAVNPGETLELYVGDADGWTNGGTRSPSKLFGVVRTQADAYGSGSYSTTNNCPGQAPSARSFAADMQARIIGQTG